MKRDPTACCGAHLLDAGRYAVDGQGAGEAGTKVSIDTTINEGVVVGILEFILLNEVSIDERPKRLCRILCPGVVTP